MYEYRVFEFQGAGDLAKELNERAEEGWRLVQTVEHGRFSYFIFERPKIDSKSLSTPTSVE
jgi:Domain of unknown function (DUF4177)